MVYYKLIFKKQKVNYTNIVEQISLLFNGSLIVAIV